MSKLVTPKYMIIDVGPDRGELQVLQTHLRNVGSQVRCFRVRTDQYRTLGSCLSQPQGKWLVLLTLFPLFLSSITTSSIHSEYKLSKLDFFFFSFLLLDTWLSLEDFYSLESFFGEQLFFVYFEIHYTPDEIHLVSYCFGEWSSVERGSGLVVLFELFF